MKMSEICRKAANEHLICFYDDRYDSQKFWNAVFAVDRAGGEKAFPRFLDFLDGNREERLFTETEEDHQAARFMLLHFAAHYFEDLGE
jgi:hypothetical protein